MKRNKIKEILVKKYHFTSLGDSGIWLERIYIKESNGKKIIVRLSIDFVEIEKLWLKRKVTIPYYNVTEETFKKHFTFYGGKKKKKIIKKKKRSKQELCNQILSEACRTPMPEYR